LGGYTWQREHRVSAAGEWRRIILEQGIPSVSDVFLEVHPSQADDVGSIPITRSNLHHSAFSTGGW